MSNTHFTPGRSARLNLSKGSAAHDYHAYVALAGGYSVAEIDSASDTILADNIGADSPGGLAVTPDADRVSVLSTARDRVIKSLPTGHLPGSVAVTPDGSQVRVGNTLSGTITVINPATQQVVGTISGGPGTAALDAAPLGIAFVTKPVAP